MGTFKRSQRKLVFLLEVSILKVRQFYWKVPNFDKPIGKLTYDIDSDIYTIEVFDVDREYLPFYMTAIADFQNGHLTGDMARSWVASRVEPPERPEISDILKCAGLKSYSVFGLLVFHKGKACYDKMYLEEIKEA